MLFWVRIKRLLPLKNRSCRARTRSYEEELEQQSLAKADSHIDSQALRDPILARLVMAWPSLSEERKKIIGSLLNLP